MAVTVTENRTVLDSADALTNWNQGALDTSLYAEASASVTYAVNTSTDQLFWSGTAVNFTTAGNELIYIWTQNSAVQNAWNASGGSASHAIWLSDGTNEIILYNAGNDRTVFQHSINQVLFQCFLIDVDYLDTKNTNGEIYAVSGSYASFDPTAITEVGAYYVTLSKALAGGTNIWCDVIRYGTGGISITGGTTGDRGNFQEVCVEDRSTADLKGHGIIREYTAKTYGCQGPITIGTTSTGDTWFEDSGFSLTFEDRDVGDDKFKIILLGNVTGGEETHLYLSNGTIASARPGVELDFSSTGINTIDIDGMTFSALGGLITFPTDSASYSHDIVNSLFDGADAINAGATTFTGNTIISSVVAADTSALIWNVATDPDGYLDNITIAKTDGVAHHGIEFGTTSPLTINLTNPTAIGFNASDGQNDSFFHVKRTGGTVTINVTGGVGNFKYKTAGATVNVVQSVPITITVIDADGDPIENAQTSVFLLDSPYTEIMNKDTLASGVASGTYGGSTPEDVVVKVRKSETTDDPRYFAYSRTQVIGSGGLTLTVTLEENPFV